MKLHRASLGTWFVIVMSIVAVALSVSLVMAVVGSPGSLSAISGTTSILRNFNPDPGARSGRPANLRFYADTNDISVRILNNASSALNDTLFIPAGTTQSFYNIYPLPTGFEIIRPVATACRAWWW